MLKEIVMRMCVKTKGAMEDEHLLEVTATIFENYLFSCPRHEARQGIGAPPGHSHAGKSRQHPGNQAMKVRRRWCISWSCLRARLDYRRRWQSKD